MTRASARPWRPRLTSCSCRSSAWGSTCSTTRRRLGQDTRDVFSAGLDVRVLSPWPRGDLRGYARAGVGEVGTYASAHVSTGDRGFTGFRFVPGADGSFTEAPVAIGVLYRVAPPVWFAAEVGARVGFAFAGGAYSPTSSSHGGTCPTSGDDTLAVFADLGVMWGR